MALRRGQGRSTFGGVGPSEIKTEIASSDVGRVDELLLESGRTNWSVFEDVVLGRAWIVGVCGAREEANQEWRALAGQLKAAGVSPRSEPVHRTLADEDWRHSYKAHFRAWKFDRLHWVPIWEKESFQLPRGEAVLWLDPGLAFGTGNHETTRLCVERLVALSREFRVLGSGFEGDEPLKAAASGPESEMGKRAIRVVDAGCGSGILALSAVLLGFEDVRGFDNDPEAVRISNENAALNGLQGRVRFETADLVSGLASETGQVDILLANIQADVLTTFSRQLIGAVAPGGSLILSGILANENGEVRATFERHAPEWSVNARVMGEWSDVVLVRPK